MRKHGHTHIYVPNPTWGNHIPIFKLSGLEVRKYRYYDSESSDLDFENMMKDIKDMPKGSIILLHACKLYLFETTRGGGCLIHFAMLFNSCHSFFSLYLI